MELKDKTVLLTGASSDIGKAIAKEFLKRKAKVLVFGKNKSEFCSSFCENDFIDGETIVIDEGPSIEG